MKRYFEVHYPRRLAELKAELTPIAEQYVALTKVNDEICPEAEEILKKFHEKMDCFIENTKLHIKSPTITPLPGYHDRLSPEYLLQYFGGVKTSLGLLFSITNTYLYDKIHKKEGDKS